MNDRDILYQAFQKANEERKRKNFNYFVDGLEHRFVEDLNNAYATGDTEKYEKLKNNIKNEFGAKIFRNSKGEHKISFI